MYQGSEEQLKNYLAASKKGVAKCKQLKEERILKYNANPMRCAKCDAPIEYKSRANTFCSRICSASVNNTSRTQSEKTKEKIRKTLTKPPLVKICKYCVNEFQTKRKKQKFCSRSCGSLYTGSLSEQKEIRRQAMLKTLATLSVVRRSKNEIYFAELCQVYFDVVWTNKPIFNGWDADVIIPELKIAILWNGKWHYEKLTENHSVKQVQNRDRIKIKEIKKLEYTPYIIKDMGREDKKYVEAEFEKFIQHINIK